MASPALATSEPPTMAVPDWAGEIARLKAENAALKHQLEWFKRQLFGAKSERRHLEPPPEQMSLGEGFGQAQQDPAATRPVAAHERRRRQRGEAEEPALFFDPARVPGWARRCPALRLRRAARAEAQGGGARTSRRRAGA
jgi:hypothetical protein